MNPVFPGDSGSLTVRLQCVCVCLCLCIFVCVCVCVYFSFKTSIFFELISSLQKIFEYKVKTFIFVDCLRVSC